MLCCLVPHINTLQGSSWRVGYVADLRCKQQAFLQGSGSLQSCVCVFFVIVWLWKGSPDKSRISSPARPCLPYGAHVSTARLHHQHSHSISVRPGDRSCVFTPTRSASLRLRLSRWFTVPLNATRVFAAIIKWRWVSVDRASALMLHSRAPLLSDTLHGDVWTAAFTVSNNCCSFTVII